MYGESASRIPGARLWCREPADGPDPAQSILPDGCIDLIWLDGDLLVAGPDTVAHPVTIRAASRYSAIRLSPGAGPELLGIPAHEIRNSRPSLHELWPAGAVLRWTDRLSSTAPNERCLMLERLSAQQLEQHPVPAVTSGIAAALAAGATVTEVAQQVGWGDRRLLRHCRAAFGYGPQTLRRILRFDRAVRAARSGRRLADVAADTGYADQAHLAREAKTFGGAPLSQLTA